MPLFARYPTYQIFIAALFALALTLTVTPFLIRYFQSRGIGQLIREDGPQNHLSKAGTPTMGGILILISVVLSYVLMAQPWNTLGSSTVSLLVLGAMVGCGLLGFGDDIVKIGKARSLGLKARSKLLIQLVITVVFGGLLINYADISTSVGIPAMGLSVDLGVFYYPFIYIIIAGMSNAVNLTDGLDGLAVGTVMIVMGAYAAIAFRQKNLQLALLAASIAGSCIGILWYNAYPAKIFIGDTGSLGLGGAIAAMAIATKTELLLILIGGIYVMEILSVIIQVIAYRFWGRRVFRMAPIHHHFELSGWSETTIMVRFWIVTAVLAGAGFSLYFVGGFPGAN